MTAKEKVPSKSNNDQSDLELAFDVGHSSLGWAVLQSSIGPQPSTLNLLGCGAVVFRADDCLASERRGYRRQRRHIRSTRQRIARMKVLLAHLGVLKKEDLNQPGCAWPWLLAARVLRGGKLLTWAELWDVLRWYAHNRGYDGNRRWSSAVVENKTPDLDDVALERILNDSSATQDEKDDAEKVKAAKKIMRDLHTNTMSETFCAICGLDPLGQKKSTSLAGDKRPKGQNAAFPRATVEAEVRHILQAHFGKLPKVDASLERVLLGRDNQDRTAWQAIPCPELKLPKRYEGALLFGQLVPRFDNRIIAQCPITFAEEYQRLIGEGFPAKEAKDRAAVLAKVPGRNCAEFLNFRWAMTLANIRIGHGSETYRDRDGKEVKLRPLTAEERRKIDACVRQLGFLKVEPDKPGKDGLVREGRNKLRQIVTEETKCDRHNLEGLLLDPNAKDGLELLPIDGDTTAFRVGWACFDAPAHDAEGFYRDSALRHRFTTQLLRQKKLSLNAMIQQLDNVGGSAIAIRIREAARKAAADRRGTVNEEKLGKLLAAEFFCPKLRGRARFSRVKLRQAFQGVFRTENPIHPLETGGCLEQTEAIKQAAAEKELAEQTNNHLVRHRLLILERLLADIIKEKDYAAGDKRRVARITVELARDLQEVSGMTNKKKAKELGAKLAHHQAVSADLAEKLRDANGNPLRDVNGRPFAASPGLIRKARILDDLGGHCPYTGRDIEFVHLANPHPAFGTADKDHIIPRSQRLSDALEAQVITFSEINRLKGRQTALQFIQEMNLPSNSHHKNRFGIKTEAQFRRDVNGLWPPKDPFKRARAGGKRVTDDEARCWRRKQLLLKPTWEGKDFTPADLAKTRHIVKLAAQQLEAAFSDLPKEERPPVIAITGAVTASFRDKSWKLLGELAAVNPAVKQVLADGAREWDAGKDFNPKKAVREITHLHHALDSTALALVTNLLVPPKHQSLDGDLARFVVKGKLTVDKEKDEVSAFRALCAKLRLPDFARLDSNNRLHIEDLSAVLKAQIRQRLAEKRVVQHIPARMGGLPVDLNMWRLCRWDDEGKAILEKHSRDVSGKRKRDVPKAGANNKQRLIGWNPRDGDGKLKRLKAVLITNENYGAAILDEAASADDRLKMIPFLKVFPFIFGRKEEHKKGGLVALNQGQRPRILRSGHLIQVPRGTHAGSWRVFSVKNNADGIAVSLGEPDALGCRKDKQNVGLKVLLRDGLQIVSKSLSGVSACPTTSSA